MLEKVAEFCKKEKIDPVRKLDEYDLLRFCRARNFILADVQKMMLNYAKWRKENDVDLIHENFVHVEKDVILDFHP